MTSYSVGESALTLTHQTGTLLCFYPNVLDLGSVSLCLSFFASISAHRVCDVLHLKILVESGISELFQLESCLPMLMDLRAASRFQQLF